MQPMYPSKTRNLSRRKLQSPPFGSQAQLNPHSKQNHLAQKLRKDSQKKFDSKCSASNSRYSSSGKLPHDRQKRKEKRKAVASLGQTLCMISNNITPFQSPRSSTMQSPVKISGDRQLTRESFRFLQKIGSGGFGQVWKVEFKKNSRAYAMKQISKAKVIVKKSVQSILNEKDILCTLFNPFIVNMKCAFQDRDNLYLVLDYLTGGDLRYHLCSKTTFAEDQAKFLIACIVQSLEYIHQNNILHRDIKPENLVFQSSGYLRLTDFGIARKRKEKNANETSGTPGYMSPQVICRLNHSFEADYFALGVIAYEFMLRKRPYVGNSRKEIREHILSKQVLVSRYELPRGWSIESADFINRLLQRKREARLGYNGIEQLKQHPWLESINWQKLKNKELRPPFSPRNLCQTTEYIREIEFSDSSQPTNEDQQRILLRSAELQSELFQSYNEIGSFKMYYGKDSTKSTFYTYCQWDDK